MTKIKYNDDMTVEEYIDSLSPAQQSEIAKFTDKIIELSEQSKNKNDLFLAMLFILDQIEQSIHEENLKKS